MRREDESKQRNSVKSKMWVGCLDFFVDLANQPWKVRFLCFRRNTNESDADWLGPFVLLSSIEQRKSQMKQRDLKTNNYT